MRSWLNSFRPVNAHTLSCGPFISVVSSQQACNYLANALFEMKAGGTLSVILESDDKEALVTVSDTGRGIPEEHLNNIFDPFFTTKDRGTGFGLSVVLRIVKTYAGRINVESNSQGTSFQIWLPLA